MKNKKNIFVILLVFVIICGMGFVISTSMSYAKDYDRLVKDDETKQPSPDLVNNRKNIVINGQEYQVDYANGVDFEEGITVQKALESSIAKLEEEFLDSAGKVAREIYIWDYNVEDNISTLESQASWGIEYKIQIPISPTRNGATKKIVEVDKYTGTCIENEGQGPKEVTLGEYTVFLRTDGRLDISEGITVEKAIQKAEEKTKQMFNDSFIKKGISVNGYYSKYEEDKKDIWRVGASTNDGLVTIDINKYTSEITSLSYQSNDRYNRMGAFYDNQDPYVAKDIDTEADGDTVTAEISKYLTNEKSSKYHQIARDFVDKYQLNQEVGIKSIQTIVENCDFMFPLFSEIIGPTYVVEVALDNGKYIIVKIEKATDIPFEYYESSLSFEEKLAEGIQRNKDNAELMKEREEW